MAKNNFQATFDLFLDNDNVVRQIGQKTARRFTIIGGAVRKTARRQIRTKKKGATKAQRRRLRSPDPRIREAAVADLRRKQKQKQSQPGQHPIAHTSHKVRTVKNILFFYDPKKMELVVGPIKISQKTDNLVPETLEKGGIAKWKGSGKYRGRKFQKKIEARPNTAPAWDKIRPMIPKLLKDYLNK